MTNFAADIVKLLRLNVEKGQSSVSGLSSGAFMTVQLHLAHSASFTGAGVVAGGPYRGVETFRGSALIAEDAWEINAMQLCIFANIGYLFKGFTLKAKLCRRFMHAIIDASEIF